MKRKKNIKDQAFVRLRNPYAVSAMFRVSAGAMKDGKKRDHKKERRRGKALIWMELAALIDRS